MQSIHFGQDRTVGAVFQLILHLVHIPQAEIAGGIASSRPKEFSVFFSQFFRGNQDRHDLTKVWENVDIVG